jgi:hypothetical protein
MQQKYICIFLLILTPACTHSKDVPKDFGFRIETETTIINSFDSSYTVHYIDSNSVVKLNFSKNEMNKIYNIFLKNRLDNLPTILKPKCDDSSPPIFTTRFDFRINEVYYQTEYASTCKDDYLKFLTRNRIKRIDACIKFCINPN